MVSIELDITFVIQAALFIVLMFILNVLIYKPILRVLDERSKRLATLDLEASSAEKKVEDKLVEYRTKINAAKEEGNAVRVSLKKEGLDREAQLLQAAHDDANKTITASRDKISKEMTLALDSLKAMTEEMGKIISEKVAGRA